MTYEEANRTENIIKLLNKRRMCPCGYCTDDKCVPEPLMDACLKQDFVINKAIEALEKQIPKKPALKHFKFVSDEKICPACFTFDIFDSEGCELDFCSNCGQAIDWSDTDDTSTD